MLLLYNHDYYHCGYDIPLSHYYSTGTDLHRAAWNGHRCPPGSWSGGRTAGPGCPPTARLEGRGCAQKWRVWPSKMVVSTIKKWWFHGLTWFNHQRCGLKHQKWWSQHQKCCFKHQTCGFHHQQWYSNGNIIGILRDITVSPIKSQAFNPFPKGDLILGWVTAKRWRGSDCTVKWFQNRSNLYNRDIRDIRYHIIIIITSFTEISEICYDI